MNTKTKSLTSIVAVLILAITTFMLVGCNQTLPMSFAEFQDFQLSAAKTFKAQHSTVANFNAW